VAHATLSSAPALRRYDTEPVIPYCLMAMFAVGASRGPTASVRWWKAGLEMLGLGAVVAALAYASGRIVAAIVAGYSRGDDSAVWPAAAVTAGGLTANVGRLIPGRMERTRKTGA
jgi:hypothetical protein